MIAKASKIRAKKTETININNSTPLEANKDAKGSPEPEILSEALVKSVAVEPTNVITTMKPIIVKITPIIILIIMFVLTAIFLYVTPHFFNNDDYTYKVFAGLYK